MAKAVQKEELAVKLDEKDLLILKQLQQNARASVKDITASINLTPTPVHERIRRMEDNGVIKQYATLVDPGKIGKGLIVICYVSLREHNKIAGAKFIKTVQSMNEIIECYNISGEFDFMLKVVAEDMNTYYDFHVNKLSQVENMGQVQSIFVMGVIKQTHQLVF